MLNHCCVGGVSVSVCVCVRARVRVLTFWTLQSGAGGLPGRNTSAYRRQVLTSTDAGGRLGWPSEISISDYYSCLYFVFVALFRI